MFIGRSYVGDLVSFGGSIRLSDARKQRKPTMGVNKIEDHKNPQNPHLRRLPKKAIKTLKKI